ncbi:hypothetical protein BASA81_006546 [Batrachochytrium salamandrivorans]|nr:hypothetical protein BASA81_006546 [Batrachochytrium salamandrivorans]
MEEIEGAVALLKSYFKCLEAMKSKKVSERKSGVGDLVKLLKLRFVEFQQIDASGRCQLELGMGFWDHAFGAVSGGFESELARVGKDVGPLKEFASMLAKLVTEVFVADECPQGYFYHRFGFKLVGLCKLVLDRGEADPEYSACCASFALILKQALKTRGVVEFALVDRFYRLSLERLLPKSLMDKPEELGRFADSQHKGVNFAEICKLCMQCWEFELPLEHHKPFLAICAEYCQSLGLTKRPMTQVDIDLLTALQQFVHCNGMDCLDSLRVAGGGRIVSNLICVERSVARHPAVLGVIRSMGSCVAEFTAHHGNDFLSAEDLKWLEVERIQANLMPYLTTFVVTAMFEEMGRRALDMSHQSLELASDPEALASCAADYVYYGDFAVKERVGAKGALDLLLDEGLAAGAGDLDVNATSARCQRLIVLNSLLVRWKHSKALQARDLPQQLFNRLEHVWKHNPGGNKIEVFWLVTCLGSAAALGGDNNRALIWNPIFEALATKVMVGTRTSTTLLLRICAANAMGGAMSAMVAPEVLAKGLELMWSSGVVFTKLTSKHVPLYLGRFLSSLPLLPLAPIEFKPKPQLREDKEEEEEGEDSPSLRCDLIKWCAGCAFACEVSSIKDIMVFADAIGHLLTKSLFSPQQQQDIGDQLTRSSALYREWSSSVTPTTTTATRQFYGDCARWVRQTLLEKRKYSPKLLLVLTQVPECIDLTVKCLRELVGFAVECEDLGLLSHLQLGLAALPVSCREASQVKSDLWDFATSQLDLLFAPPAAFPASKPKPAKRLKPSREEEEEDEMMGRGSQDSGSQASQRSKSSDIKPAATSSFTASTKPQQQQLAPINSPIARHCESLALLLVSACQNPNEAFDFLSTKYEACQDVGLFVGLGKALVKLCERDVVTFGDEVLGLIVPKTADWRQNSWALSSCAESLMVLAKLGTKFSAKQCKSWFVDLKLFLNPDATYGLRLRASKGALLTRAVLVDFTHALFVFASNKQVPEEVFNLAINVLVGNLTHHQERIRTLCASKLAVVLDQVDDRAAFLTGVLDSNNSNNNGTEGWSYNQARTHLVFASQAATRHLELFPEVLVRFARALNRTRRARRKILVIRLLVCLIKELAYKSAKQVLIAHAQFLWDAFLLLPSGGNNGVVKLEDFPYELFGLESTEELCSATRHVLVPMLLLRGREDLLPASLDLSKQRANVLGLLGTMRVRPNEALETFARMTRISSARPCTGRELGRATNQALLLFCLGNDQITLHSIANFITGTKVSVRAAFAEVNSVEVLLQLKYVLTFPRTWTKALECLGEVFLRWMGSEVVTEPVAELWVNVVLFVFVRSELDRQQALRLLEQARPRISRFARCQASVLALTSSQPVVVTAAARKLVEMFSFKRFPAPGACDMTSSYLLSVCPLVKEPQCEAVLIGLMGELRTINNNGGGGSEELPLEVVRCLRPFFESEHVRQEAATDDDDDSNHGVLVQSLLTLCGGDISDRIRALAGACLSKLGVLAFDAHSDHHEQQQDGDDEEDDDEEDLLKLKTSVLEWLVEMLFHEDAMLSLCACRALKQVLRTESGAAARGRLPQGKASQVLSASEWTPDDEKEEGDEDGDLLDLLESKRAVVGDTNSLSPQLWANKDAGLKVEDWVCVVADLMCRDATVACDEFIQLLGPACLLEPRFAKMLFPWIVYVCVRSADNAQAAKDFTLCFQRVFAGHQLAIQRLLVETVSFLRGRSIAATRSSSAPVAGTSSRACNRNPAPAAKDYRGFWLNLDLLKVASVALKCGMPSTVIMCVEIWQEGNEEGESDVFSTKRPEHDELTLGAYRLLNDRDAVLGVKRTINLRDSVEDRMFDGDWLGALEGYDAMRLQAWGSSSSDLGLISGQAVTLSKLGLVHTMSGVLSSLSDGSNHNELKHEAAWRAQAVAAKWTFGERHQDCEPASIHSVLINAYSAMHSGNQAKLDQARKVGVRLLLDDLCDTESLETVNQCVSRLSICLDLERNPQQQPCLTQEHFAAREGVLRISNDGGGEEASALRLHLVAFAEFHRLRGDAMSASLVLDRLRQVYAGASELDLIKLYVQDAMVCWMRGDEDTALRVAKHCHAKLAELHGNGLDTAAMPALTCLVGFWFAKSSLASSQVVITEWFSKAVEECHSDDLLASGIHGLLATFVDRQFRALDSRMRSPEHIARQELQRLRNEELLGLKAELETARDKSVRNELRNIVSKREKECQNDEKESQGLVQSHESMLLLAVRHLMMSLVKSKAAKSLQTSVMFRVVHLWFHHRRQVNNLMQEWLVDEKVLPSKHLIPLVYQIVSRVDLPHGGGGGDDDEEAAFLQTINGLVERLALDHPFETLPHLFALANANRLASLTEDASATATTTTSSKAKVASKLLDGIQSQSREMNQICEGLRATYDAFIALAYHTTAKDQKQFNTNQCADFVKAKQKIPWGLLPLPCSSRASPLKNLTLAGIEDKYRVTDQGISVPKIITLVASNGTRTKLLVKGKDDLRQDFVMELILGFVSELLLQQKGRNMRLRTYNVLPLTPAAGLIEWVDHTTSFGNYLYGGSSRQDTARSAHGRLRPNDPTFYMCMHELKDAADNGRDRLAAYRSVAQRFQPVFRHFFYERFGHDPREWHQRRDAYTRSTAANSMVGMILGIGDRHAQNILIDERTAEANARGGGRVWSRRSARRVYQGQCGLPASLARQRGQHPDHLRSVCARPVTQVERVGVKAAKHRSHASAE